MKLNDLRPNEGAKKRRQRVGRGIAAGQGKSAGRGTKGEGAREGSRGRQGTHPGVRRHRARHAPRRRARVVHGAEDFVRPGRRTHIPAAFADYPEGGSRALGQGAACEAVLPARSEG